MKTLEDNLKPYSKALVRLLKSPVKRESNVWDNIIIYQKEIMDYVSEIGLELIVKKDEGFAFLKQYEDSEGNTLGLIPRRQIGFEASLVLIVLRQSLEEFDSNPTQFQAAEKFITNTEIKEELDLFLPEKFNRVKLLKEIDNTISKIEELGYLIEVNKSSDEIRYQIHRIIKEKVTLDDLKEFKLKLQEYVKSI